MLRKQVKFRLIGLFRASSASFFDLEANLSARRRDIRLALIIREKGTAFALILPDFYGRLSFQFIDRLY